MRKNPRKIALIGLAASVVFGTSACANNEPADVYGPPVTTQATTEDNEISGVYGPAIEDFTEDDNEAPTVYGPPQDMTEDTTEEITVEDNQLEDVYGPPADLDWDEDGDK